ncbi:MAG: hypothetical protein AVDCRST_MAG11-2019, partial [uncultured Gemmatimonadaceae bacterium]
MCALAVTAAAGVVGAQPVLRDSAPGAAAPRRSCFRPRPRAACRGFSVVEAGVYPRLAGTEAPRPWGARPQLGNHASWELGYMVNTRAGTALGGSAVLGVSGAGARWGAKARYRRWLPGEFAADLGAGPVVADVAVPVTASAAANPVLWARGVGATADVGVSWRGTVGLGLRAEAVRARGGTARAAYA